MPSKQYEVCLGVLRRLRDAGALDHLVLIGSWCLVLYREYFRDATAFPAVRTRDMDFLVPSLARPRSRVDVPALLKELGFVVGFRGRSGVMLLEHPELMVEFLVPERGRGGKEVQALPQLGVNAQPLRLLDIATMKTVRLHFEDVLVTAPHPAAFALHKILVAPRRSGAEKKTKDLDAALLVLERLEQHGELGVVRDLVASFPRPWRKIVLSTLRQNRREALAHVIEKL